MLGWKLFHAFYSIHHAWSPFIAGWMYAMGFQDMSGGGPIHMLGATVGLVFTWGLGPRQGVFTPTGRWVRI